MYNVFSSESDKKRKAAVVVGAENVWLLINQLSKLLQINFLWID